MYFVYILQSQKDNKMYVGMTRDVEARLIRHNAGHVRSTSHRRPFKVIYTELHSTRELARKREVLLKSYGGAREKLDIIEKSLRIS